MLNEALLYLINLADKGFPTYVKFIALSTWSIWYKNSQGVAPVNDEIVYAWYLAFIEISIS